LPERRPQLPKIDHMFFSKDLSFERHVHYCVID